LAQEWTSDALARSFLEDRENGGVVMLTYRAVYERAEDGTIWGYAPEVPGAFGAGDTLAEAKVSLREGIRVWIEIARERGYNVPASEPAPLAVELIDVPVS
jgi:predicted RNase H-like HicB family nuclease